MPKAALVQLSPPALLTVYGDIPNPMFLPNGDHVHGAGIGWTNGSHKLVAVVPFSVPDGQRTAGPASYALDGNGDVVETFATEAIPPTTMVATSTLLGRLTDAELLGLEQAMAAGISAGNIHLARWFEDARSRETIDLQDPVTIAAKAGIVAAGFLTPDRADAVFAP